MKAARLAMRRARLEATSAARLRITRCLRVFSLSIIVAGALSASAQAAPPLISQTAVSAVTETSATLNGDVDPNGGLTKAHFEYTTQADFKSQGFAAATSAPSEAITVRNKTQGKGDLLARVDGLGEVTQGSVTITGIEEVSGGPFRVGQRVAADGLVAETTITALTPTTLTISRPAFKTSAGKIGIEGVAPPEIIHVSASAGTFVVGQTVSAADLARAARITSVEEEAPGLLRLGIDTVAVKTVSQETLNATGPQAVSTTVSGLAPGTAYVFRLLAEKGNEQVPGPASDFSTFGPPPSFPACPSNEAFRSGQYAPAGHPSALLPDCRAFELASPLEKNGNNLRSFPGFARVAEDGSAITFGATFGLPAGVGAQTVPFYEASRGTEGWSSTGVNPPAATGDETRILIGQLPDLSATYAAAIHLTAGRPTALFELHRDASPATQLTPYVSDLGQGDFGFAGAPADASSVVLESPTDLPQTQGGTPIEGSAPGSPNVYSWQRSTGQLHLTSVMNTPEETAALLAKGAYAGPYNWAANNLASDGGAAGNYYLSEEHAVTEDGSVFFTSRSTGHVYERLNPTEPQSAMEAGHCAEPARACTIDISASAPGVNDPAGEAPAAFQAATPDGSTVYFTSSQKLTSDANTGPEQPAAQIGTAKLNGERAATEPNESLIPAHALGIAVDPKGEYIYWADPSKHSIGRAKLNAAGDGIEGAPDQEFIVPGETSFETHPKKEPGVITSAPTAPRYVAVGPCAGGGECVYWTNTGPRGDYGADRGLDPVRGAGTIGRASVGPSGSEDIDPAFITGASNPQGIAVNVQHVYWANSTAYSGGEELTAAVDSVGRADLSGASREGQFLTFFTHGGGEGLSGLAIDETKLYVITNDSSSTFSHLDEFPVDGGVPKSNDDSVSTASAGVGSHAHSLSLVGGIIYWTNDGSIGRCLTLNCHEEFLTPQSTPFGLAATNNHIYYSVNGESKPNPGNDLYRYQAGAAEPLTDLTPDSADENGAEVQGVLGTSADGSYLYFAANADLDGPGEAEAGNCKGTGEKSTGHCSVYLYHDGQISFVFRTGPAGAINWLGKAELGATSFNSIEKSSKVSPDGKTLIFKEGRLANVRRFRAGEGTICLTCNPTGIPTSSPVTFGESTFQVFNPGDARGALQVGFASKDANRVFFETPEAMVGADTDSASGCPLLPLKQNIKAPSCLDVYEWEAPGTGSCVTDGPGYSFLNQGCVYWLSPDTDSGPAYFLNASASGDDVFILTTAGLVGEDTDELIDVYDARVGGGLASQNSSPTPTCEVEGCKPAPTPAPNFQTPPHFSGPGNPKPKRCKGKHCHHKRHGKKHHKKSHRPANRTRGSK